MSEIDLIPYPKTEATKSGHGSASLDVEQGQTNDIHFHNTEVDSFAWSDITVTVKDNKIKEDKVLLDHVNGIVRPGEVCAIMGPSGSGKTTLLNVLARRGELCDTEGRIMVNGSTLSLQAFRKLSSYVEQEDALIGALTVWETINFAARLSSSLSRNERMARINHLIQAFGLTNQANTIVGTPIRKGLSGGQKRRLGVASQLITGPRMVFLDEPTSGLDSAASYEVMSFISKLAKENQLIVILSIHQPSTSTFYLFDRLLLLSAGRTQYFGSVEDATTHYAAAGNPVPRHCNPAEYYLQLLNQDFTSDQMVAQQRLGRLNEIWASSTGASHLKQMIDNIMARREDNISLETRVSGAAGRAKNPAIVAALVHRSFIKSYRDLITYGVRLAMYSGLAIMMGTVWLRLDDNQSSIQPFINCIFFGSAFMSFMAVAYIPSFLEDRSTFIKERANGLYGAAAFHIANFILGLPYLFLFSVTFSILAYWLVALQPTAQAFFTWIMWIFLDLVAAESLVVLVSSIFPNFVVALALVAFANGLWMSVGGFMVTPKVLNVFWKYVFHYIDYQTYVFQGMMVNEFKDRTYVCQQTPSGCSCMYESPLASQCKIAGQGVLAEYEYPTNQMGLWVGIMIGIIAGYRLLGWAVLAMKKH